MNPITAKEIIESEDIINKLNDVKGNLEGLRTALQDVGKGEKLKLSEIVSTQGMEKAAERVRVLADAMEALRTAYKENEEMIKQLNGASTAAAEIRKKNAEAAKLEAEAVREQAKAERDLAKAQQQASSAAEKNAKAEEALENAIKMLNGEIDTQKLSYNQLSAMYSLMSARLKNMSAETINSTEDNRKLAAATKQVRDAMNDAQKAMGNYSLNVGRYHTAFDGLGFSIQQVLREIPSATTISQFFLAISNNIPMIVDQIKAFREKQEGIKEQLGELQEGTKEYMELQSKQMSLGQKIFKSIFSWQTAIIGLILILRKFGEGWIKSILNAIKGVEVLNNEISKTAALGKLASESFYNWRKTQAELFMIRDRIDDVVKGSDEWNKMIARISELTGQNLTTLDLTKDRVKDITDEYIRQSKQIAINQAIIAQLGESDANRLKRSLSASATSPQAVAGILGVDIFKKGSQDNTAEYSAIEKAYNKIYKEAGMMFTSAERVQKEIKRALLSPAEFGRGLNRDVKNAIIDYTNIIKGYTQVLETNAYSALESLYQFEDDSHKSNDSKNKREREKHFKDIDYMEREALESRANMAEGFFEKEVEMNQVKYRQELYDLDKKHQKEQDKITGNYDILREKYKGNAEKLQMLEDDGNKDKERLSENWWQVRISLDQKYALLEQSILDKYEKKNVKDRIEDYDTLAKEQMKSTSIRVNGIDSEMAKNDALRQNIAILNEELLKLYALREVTWGSDAQGDIDKAIQRIQSNIAKSRNGISFNQRTNAKNFSLQDMFSESISSKQKIAMMKSAGFSDADIDDMLSQGVFGDNFDKMMANTLNALKTWKDTTIDYIGDIIDAYIQLAEAKAEAAREETETAKEEYEKQKSLMDAGYANSMETAYMEYREKQELQRQAEAEAKQAQKAQQAIDTASQVSSLVTASANIWAQASKTGLMSPVVAGALLATMWGSFLVAKAKAMQVANYGDGGYEIMQGGSHASGHDINLGVKNRNGKVMHVEGGEGLAVISNRAKRRYGHGAIESVINSINNGTFDVKAGELTRVTPMIVSRSSSVSLSKVENTLNDIKIGVNKQSYVTANGDIIEIEGSLKRTIHTR